MAIIRTARAGVLRPGTIVSLVVVALLLTACGPFSDDEDEPTTTPETIAQPTTGATDEPAGETPDETATEVADEPTEEATEEPTADATEVSSPDAATPQLAPGDLRDLPSTPNADFADAATPVEGGETESPSGPEPTTATFSGSDGTSGATPISARRTDEAAATPAAGEATPFGTPSLAVFEETRTTGTLDLSSIEPVSVDSCSPDNVPILIDGDGSFVTNSSVNFRNGPGADCDAIGNGPLGAGLPVEVTSAPVDREGDDYIWVQIRVNDIVGWVVIDSLDPA